MRNRTAFLVICAALSAAGCGPREGVLAVVGDVEVEVTRFQEHLAAATGEAWEGATGPVASRLLDQFLEQEVVLVAANREAAPGVSSEPGVRSAQVRLLLDGLCGPPPPPDADVVQAAMVEALAEERPARAQVRQMLLDSREQAEDASRRLDEGADFVELSKAVSRAPNAAGGGHLGLLVQGGLPENLDEVIFALEAGEISEPVPGPSGYHIFQVLEVFPAGPPPRAEVEAEIVRREEEASARKHSSSCVRRLAAEVGVDVIHDRLWFTYTGRYAEVLHED
ncbi:MAG: peptidylprolyl isomerase [Thermoanaerobaculales bacterium]|jgi:hypothetical protein|nr:peptidylprolyl isomerase [Thermoanaerobaculales bacterium]